jgi:hypothetical protein
MLSAMLSDNMLSDNIMPTTDKIMLSDNMLSDNIMLSDNMLSDNIMLSDNMLSDDIMLSDNMLSYFFFLKTSHTLHSQQINYTVQYIIMIFSIMNKQHLLFFADWLHALDSYAK